MRAVVVFTGTDISARTVKVNVYHARCQLALVAGQPWKVWVGFAGPIVALGMRGKIGQYREWLIVIPETDQFHYRVDDAFRIFSNCRVCRGSPAHVSNLAVRTQNPAIGSHLLDRAL